MSIHSIRLVPTLSAGSNDRPFAIWSQWIRRILLSVSKTRRRPHIPRAYGLATPEPWRSGPTPSFFSKDAKHCNINLRRTCTPELPLRTFFQMQIGLKSINFNLAKYTRCRKSSPKKARSSFATKWINKVKQSSNQSAAKLQRAAATSEGIPWWSCWCEVVDDDVTPPFTLDGHLPLVSWLRHTETPPVSVWGQLKKTSEVSKSQH